MKKVENMPVTSRPRMTPEPVKRAQLQDAQRHDRIRRPRLEHDEERRTAASGEAEDARACARSPSRTSTR